MCFAAAEPAEGGRKDQKPWWLGRRERFLFEASTLDLPTMAAGILVNVLCRTGTSSAKKKELIEKN